MEKQNFTINETGNREELKFEIKNSCTKNTRNNVTFYTDSIE